MPSFIVSFILAIILGVCSARGEQYWVGANGTNNLPTGGIWQDPSPMVWSATIPYSGDGPVTSFGDRPSEDSS